MKRVFLILLTLVLFTNNISSQSFKGYKTLKTEHFDFVYEPLSKEFVPLYARYAEEAYKKIAKYYSIPDEKIPVYITDRTNIVNAFTYSFPNSIMMFTTPVMTNDFTFRENWMKAFITHELIHSANFSFEDKDKALSKIFGGGISSLDFSDYPTWALEGLAVTLETEFTNGGRGRSPYFELYYKQNK